jgi:hypothetical protein
VGLKIDNGIMSSLAGVYLDRASLPQTRYFSPHGCDVVRQLDEANDVLCECSLFTRAALGDVIPTSIGNEGYVNNTITASPPPRWDSLWKFPVFCCLIQAFRLLFAIGTQSAPSLVIHIKTR